MKSVFHFHRALGVSYFRSGQRNARDSRARLENVEALLIEERSVLMSRRQVMALGDKRIRRGRFMPASCQELAAETCRYHECCLSLALAEGTVDVQDAEA